MNTVFFDKYNELDAQIKKLAPVVAQITGREILSVNASIGMQYQPFCDVKQRAFGSPEELKNAYFSGWHSRILFLVERSKRISAYANLQDNKEYQTFIWYCTNDTIKHYVHLFLERSFYKYHREYMRQKPPLEEILWIGSNPRTIGIGITPRYKDNQWENDRSEVRKTPFEYWTIDHIMHTGFLKAGQNKQIQFDSVDDYLHFLVDFVKEDSNSPHELYLTKMYSEYVKNHTSPRDVPLLIPQFRYGGLEIKHQYRLDFLIIIPSIQKKYGFELSPYSTHRSFKEYEKDNQKRNDFLNKYDIVCAVLTDKQLKNPALLFQQIEVYLESGQKSGEILSVSNERLFQLYNEIKQP